MSVRVTERLIGDVVIVTGLSSSPKMIVQSIDEEAKIVTAVWFSAAHEYQEGYFPGSALDRVEIEKAVKEKKAADSKAPRDKTAVRGRGRKPKQKG